MTSAASSIGAAAALPAVDSSQPAASGSGSAGAAKPPRSPQADWHQRGENVAQRVNAGRETSRNQSNFWLRKIGYKLFNLPLATTDHQPPAIALHPADQAARTRVEPANTSGAPSERARWGTGMAQEATALLHHEKRALDPARIDPVDLARIVHELAQHKERLDARRPSMRAKGSGPAAAGTTPNPSVIGRIGKSMQRPAKALRDYYDEKTLGRMSDWRIDGVMEALLEALHLSSEIDVEELRKTFGSGGTGYEHRARGISLQTAGNVLASGAAMTADHAAAGGLTAARLALAPLALGAGLTIGLDRLGRKGREELAPYLVARAPGSSSNAPTRKEAQRLARELQREHAKWRALDKNDPANKAQELALAEKILFLEQKILDYLHNQTPEWRSIRQLGARMSSNAVSITGTIAAFASGPGAVAILPATAGLSLVPHLLYYFSDAATQDARDKIETLFLANLKSNDWIRTDRINRAEIAELYGKYAAGQLSRDELAACLKDAFDTKAFANMFDRPAGVRFEVAKKWLNGRCSKAMREILELSAHATKQQDAGPARGKLKSPKLQRKFEELEGLLRNLLAVTLATDAVRIAAEEKDDSKRCAHLDRAVDYLSRIDEDAVKTLFSGSLAEQTEIDAEARMLAIDDWLKYLLTYMAGNAAAEINTFDLNVFHSAVRAVSEIHMAEFVAAHPAGSTDLPSHPAQAPHGLKLKRVGPLGALSTLVTPGGAPVSATRQNFPKYTGNRRFEIMKRPLERGQTEDKHTINVGNGIAPDKLDGAAGEIARKLCRHIVTDDVIPGTTEIAYGAGKPLSLNWHKTRDYWSWRETRFSDNAKIAWENLRGTVLPLMWTGLVSVAHAIFQDPIRRALNNTRNDRRELARELGSLRATVKEKWYELADQLLKDARSQTELQINRGKDMAWFLNAIGIPQPDKLVRIVDMPPDEHPADIGQWLKSRAGKELACFVRHGSVVRIARRNSISDADWYVENSAGKKKSLTDFFGQREKFFSGEQRQFAFIFPGSAPPDGVKEKVSDLTTGTTAQGKRPVPLTSIGEEDGNDDADE